MNFSFFVARKYFFGSRISNVIHIISAISLLGVMVGTFALIVVLSVFNGFENVVLSLFNSFDSEIKITLAEGKFFHPDSARYDELAQLPEVRGITPVLEDNALLKYDENQEIATLKAIRPEYLATTGIDTMIYVGESILLENSIPFALLGAGVAGKIGVNIFSEFSRLQAFYPNRDAKRIISLTPDRAFIRMNIFPAGVFSIQQDFDSKYVLVPISFGRELFNEPEKVTAIEINLQPGVNLEKMREKVETLTGPKFVVEDRFQQHALLYRIMKTEKIAVYLILTFILLIAAFNLIGSLVMLAIEKKKDMSVLKSMGANAGLIRRIFLYEGMLLSGIGAVVGIGLGYLICWLQQEYSLIKINSGSTFVLKAYPVDFRLTDFVLVFCTAIVLGLIASYLPARIAYKQLNVADLHK
ncbi:MAG: FtsX-like permease family protein [Bacteroidia bacterium]